MKVDVVAQCANDVSRKSAKAMRLEMQLHVVLGTSPEDAAGVQRVETVKDLCRDIHFAKLDVDGAFRRYELARKASVQVAHE